MCPGLRRSNLSGRHDTKWMHEHQFGAPQATARTESARETANLARQRTGKVNLDGSPWLMTWPALL